MNRQTSIFEWITVKDDAGWAQLCTSIQPDHKSDFLHHATVLRLLKDVVQQTRHFRWFTLYQRPNLRLTGKSM